MSRLSFVYNLDEMSEEISIVDVYNIVRKTLGFQIVYYLTINFTSYYLGKWYRNWMWKNYSWIWLKLGRNFVSSSFWVKSLNINCDFLNRIPKCIIALEMLEGLATKNEREISLIDQLNDRILKLEREAHERNENKKKFEKVIFIWHMENSSQYL